MPYAIIGVVRCQSREHVDAMEAKIADKLEALNSALAKGENGVLALALPPGVTEEFKLVRIEKD